MEEPSIEINGWQATTAMAMTIRVALAGFAMDLQANGLGEDEHGVGMKEAYLARIEEINALMARSHKRIQE